MYTSQQYPLQLPQATMVWICIRSFISSNDKKLFKTVKFTVLLRVLEVDVG